MCMIFYIVLAINVAMNDVFKPTNSKHSFTKLLKWQEKLVKYQWQPEKMILQDCWTPPLHSYLSCCHRSTRTRTHTRKSPFWQACRRQLMGPSDFTDKHTYALSETQWKSILCVCSSFPLTTIISFSPLPTLNINSIPSGPPLKTTKETNTHTEINTHSGHSHRQRHVQTNIICDHRKM